jgi:NAD(P)-dependent dehydrogenase (short-subunit alcohol dehydrogenase family)
MANEADERIKMIMNSLVTNACSLEDAVMVKGKVALITGGTSGLGFTSALHLLQGGANVVLASFSEAEADIALPLLENAGFGADRVKFCKCDVTVESEVENAVQFTAEAFGTLDILVTCAGIWSYAYVQDMPEEEFMKVINVNLNGTFRAAKHVGRYMIEHGVKGKMVLVSSNVYTMPFLTFGGYCHYAASKGGIVALATEIAREYKRYGILVNSVAPGTMVTPGGSTNGIVRSLPEDKKEVLAKEKAIAKVDERPDTDAVARAVYMMCTRLSDGITGECIMADRGMAHGIVARQPAMEEYPPRG